MVNDRVTLVAAAYVLSPDCDAVILHVPAATKDTVDPDTVHTDVVEEAYETESELDAEADKSREPVVNDCEAGSANVIVWETLLTVKDRSTSSAAKYSPRTTLLTGGKKEMMTRLEGDPAWLAVIVQVPSSNNVSVGASYVPVTWHTEVVEDAADTVRPESAVAVRLTVPVANAWSPGFANVIVCSVAHSKTMSTTPSSISKPMYV